MSKKVITFYDSEKQSHDFPIITPDYGTCSTASNISAKVVTCDDFSLFSGAEITVKFTNVPTTDTITLNVNNSGAKNVDFSACGNKPYDEIKANGCYGFVYDGTSWIYKGSGKGASKVELERLKYYGDKDIVPSDESYFTVNATGETITGLTDTGKTQTELVIPYKINGVKITNLYYRLGTPILAGAHNKITKVIIPNSVTSIGDTAFGACSSLASINIPDSVTYIGSMVFYGCTSLLSVNIPNNVTNIWGAVFQGCTSLETINIPNSVTSIGNGAFKNCTSLKSINISDNVTSIGDGAFENCSSLKSITIPNSVTSIGSSVFHGCTSLKTINIPNSITSIGNDVFKNCTSLKSINISDNVTSIGQSAFQGCTSLTKIEIPNSVTSIGTGAFDGCTNLTIYCEQGSTTEIFAKEKGFNVVYTDIKDIITEIELDRIKYYGAYDIIPNDESYFTVNKTGETITGLTDEGIANLSDTIIVPYKINGIEITTLRYKDNVITSVFDELRDKLTKIILPNTITNIGDKAFEGNQALTTANIPNSVTYIGDRAFCVCTSLASINIPDTVTHIGNETFAACKSLKTVNIPNSVTSIGSYAFGNCTLLTSVNIPNSVTNIANDAFSDITPSNLTVYCEQGSYAETYAKSKNIPIMYTDIDSSKYLTKDNTTEYTPAADYQPATKKYVDDAINASSSGEATNVSTVKTCTGDELISITSPAVGSIRYVSITGTGDNISITPGLYFYLDSWKKVAIEDTAIISNEFVSGGDSTSINN